MKRLFLILAAAATFGCAKEPAVQRADFATSNSAKISNTSVDAKVGELIVCFDSKAVDVIESSEIFTKSGSGDVMTRSGVVSVDAVLESLDAQSIKPVFEVNVKSDERARKAGLHKWYIVKFDNSTNLDNAAKELAKVAEVKTIQFNTLLESANNGKVYPYDPSKATKSGNSLPFNDNALSDQWHYNNTGDKKFGDNAQAGADINLFDAWEMTTGDNSIIVAVMDSGIQYNHPDLEANMWVNKGEIPGNGIDDDQNGYVDDVYGYNFVDDGAITWDLEGDIGHGTHVAGTVAAVSNNGIGVSGVAGGSGKGDGVRIMSCQIDSAGKNASDAVAKAVKYAADNGAAIIQCSMGRGKNLLENDNDYESRYPLEMAAFEYFMSTSNSPLSDGGIVIYAAGNDAFNKPSYPGAHRKFISVSAIGSDFQPAYYTNYGDGTNIIAPGGDQYVGGGDFGMVLSTLPPSLYEGKSYGYMEGTSMACPHVSGVAALGLSYAAQLGKTFTTDEFKTMLLTSVNDVEPYMEGYKFSNGSPMNLAEYSKKMGSGLIDAAQLCLQIEGTPMLRAKVGANQLLSLSNFFGGSSEHLSYIGVEMSDSEMSKLGISESPSISYGKLKLKCSKPGVARLKITAIAGGSVVGTGEVIGGTEVSKEIAIIARSVVSENGGWL